MKKNDIVSLGMTILITLGVMFLLRHYVFSPVVVKGDSMDPTLENNERVIALINSKLERFDIVTFPAPDSGEKSYIKRIIGMPGDTIEYKGDVLYINGKATAEPYLDEYKSQLTDGMPLTTDFSLESLFGSKTVPKGKLFVLGDNRRISKDSRIIGYISEDDIMGDVKFSFWPPSRFGLIN